ncbi:SDR family oxidoreductase [Sphingomicrobium nitratireducens]|uniref:SDR family oxidoreductase n=1 Tax=Sphingomicrobium nitratireducens TaxID=2964666 RepID=UPI00223EE477|nr:SDR family oxidoreductase [Sphingomicrobium nitratireducens]
MATWFEREDQSSLAEAVRATRRRWLVTGAAGFIGSNLVESLLQLGQDVVGFDNFATGHQRNLDMVADIAAGAPGTLSFIEGDIRDREAVAAALDGVDLVLHQAALGSVPRSIADPRTSHDVNVSGFLNMLDEARLRGVTNFVYAASSSTYGDEPNLPKVEERIGNPLSPYAGTKLFNEIYADIWSRNYGFGSTGLRYFNVFGPRQDPDGAYAAVIPKWIDRMISGDEVVINGDGETSRDFCFVDNAVQANIRAALSENDGSAKVFNVAVGQRTSLNELFTRIRTELADYQVHYDREPTYADFRQGDVRHSLAAIDKARDALGYAPTHTVGQGLGEAMPYYLDFSRNR